MKTAVWILGAALLVVLSFCMGYFAGGFAVECEAVANKQGHYEYLPNAYGGQTPYFVWGGDAPEYMASR